MGINYTIHPFFRMAIGFLPFLFIFHGTVGGIPGIYSLCHRQMALYALLNRAIDLCLNKIYNQLAFSHAPPYFLKI